LSVWIAVLSAVGAVAGVIVAFAGAWLHGRRSGTKDARAKSDRDAIETRKDIDDATFDGDVRLSDEFLRTRADRRGRGDMPWHKPSE